MSCVVYLQVLMDFSSTFLASELVLHCSVAVLAHVAALAGEKYDATTVDLTLCALDLVKIDSVVFVSELTNEHGCVLNLIWCIPLLEFFFTSLISELLESEREHLVCKYCCNCS